MDAVETAAKADKKFSVIVNFEGIKKTFEVNPEQALQALFHHAIQEFGQTQNAGNLIFTIGNTDLDLNTRIENTGIQPGTEIRLRPRQTRGG
jgi:hypothetical protein